MNIMGLDLSLSETGACFPLGDNPRKTLVIKAGKLRGPERLRFIASKIAVMLSSGSVERVFIEGYSYASRAGRERLGELGGVVRLMLYERDIPFVEVPPTTLKMFATSHGNAKKPEVIAAARERLGYEGFNDNEADAIWLQVLGLTHCGEPPIQLPKAHLRALAKLSKPPSLKLS